MHVKVKKGMSNKEKILLRRYEELQYPTDRLGPGSMLTQQSHTNSSRMIMVNHNFGHMVSIKDPEHPLVPTGYEDVLGDFSSMLEQVDSDYEIVAKFEKNPYNYVLIGFDKKHRIYHAWKREELREHSEGFATRWKNKYIDSLEPGDVVPKGTYIQKSESFDKYMNYCFGKNLNTVYLVSTKVYEDGILLMNGAERMMNTFRCYTETISLSDNEILLNWYGDDSHYQGIPMVGEKVKKGYLAIVRQIDGTKAPYALKKKRLQQLERGDRAIYGSGRVIDIVVRYNKERDTLSDSVSNRVIADLYDEQQRYYRALYEYMIDIVDRAEDEKFQYTDEFSIICEEAHRYVDAATFFADSNDNIFGNIQIEITLMDEEPMLVGSKMVGRVGNKGVIARILPPEKSWHMEDGTPIHVAVATLGIVGRVNQSQMNEHSANELGATAVRMMKQTSDPNKKAKIVYDLMKYLNSEEADAFMKDFKSKSYEEKVKYCKRIERNGIVIVQDPIDNADITDFEKAYDHFKPNWQRIIFEDGKPSMRKVLCAKMFFMRLKQDPVEKYSARYLGPVSPLTSLPAKSNRKKKFLDAFSDVPVRLGEAEQEVLLTMVNHPAAIADFMMENSTSLEAKLAHAERTYFGDVDLTDLDIDTLLAMHDMDQDDLDEQEVTLTEKQLARLIYENPYAANVGKKNMESIYAYLNVLGTELVFETETADDPDEYFEN